MGRKEQALPNRGTPIFATALPEEEEERERIDIAQHWSQGTRTEDAGTPLPSLLRF